MIELLRWILGIIFTLAMFGALISTVRGFNPEAWEVKNYRQSKAIDVVLWFILLIMVIFL